MAILDDNECDLILRLAAIYESSPPPAMVPWDAFQKMVGGSEADRNRAFDRLDSLGVLQESSSGGVYLGSNILDVARAIEKEREASAAPRDEVDRVVSLFRSRPFIAWGIVVFLAVTAILTFLNSLLGIIEKLSR